MKAKIPKNIAFRVAVPLLYGSVLYVLILLVFENFDAVFESFFSNEWMFTIALSYFSSELLHLVSVLVAKKFSFAGKIWKYITVQFLVSITAEMLLVYLAIRSYFTWVEGFSVYSTELFVFEVFYLFSTILYNLFIFSFLLLNEENTVQNELETEFRLKNEYMLQALQKEIDPEVLYTAMESLLVYIRTDSKIANEIITRLSTFYRYRLENKYNELVPLSLEITALDNLILLFNNIYNQRIIYSAVANAELENYLTIPGWLQRIVLTVFKCNIISVQESFMLNIELLNDNLVLKHSSREKLLLSETDEIAAIANDFVFYTNKTITIENEDDYVKLIIPIFKKQ